MFLEKDGEKVWDKSKVYGYTDEEYLAGPPEDNTIPVEGCDEILTHDEIDHMFPNQALLLEVVDPVFDIMEWSAARVLGLHGNSDRFADQRKAAGFPNNWIIYTTYSRKVEEIIIANCPVFI